MKTIIIICAATIVGFILGKTYRDVRPLEQYCVEYHAPYAARDPNGRPWEVIWITNTCKKLEFK